MRHAIVDSNNIVVNVIIWEGSEWLPPRGHIVVRSDTCGMFDIYIPEKNVFVRPKPAIDIVVDAVKE